MNYKVTLIQTDGSRIQGYARSEYSIGNYGTVYIHINGKPHRAAEITALGMKVHCIDGEVRGVLRDTGFPLE